MSAVGRLVVIEGLDGAGKRTLTDGLTAALAAKGASVAKLAFPRYGESVHADLVREALHRGHGDLADSVYGMGVLYALDRRGAAEKIRSLRDEHDVVLLDRYVASNAAYSAARLHQDADGDVVAWVRQLEFERLALPVPDWQLYLNVPTGRAAERAARREAQDAARTRDAYERDGGLQDRTAAVYTALAAENWVGRWALVAPDVDPGELATTLLG